LIHYDLSCVALEIWDYLQVLCEGTPAEVHKQALELMGQVEWVTWDEVTGGAGFSSGWPFVWGKFKMICLCKILKNDNPCFDTYTVDSICGCSMVKVGAEVVSIKK